MPNFGVTEKILAAHSENWQASANSLAAAAGTTPEYVRYCLMHNGRNIGSKPRADAVKITRLPPPVPKTNTECQRKWLEAGKLHQCFEPTENGKTHCAPCGHHLITCLDRRPQEQERTAA